MSNGLQKFLHMEKIRCTLGGSTEKDMVAISKIDENTKAVYPSVIVLGLVLLC